MPVVSKGVVRAAGFPGNTVPALKVAGRKVQGSREIARALDEIRPDPPLFPSDAAERAKVEEAETWGDEFLQPIARRLSWWALKRNRAPMATYSEGAKLGVPVGLASRPAAPIVALSARFNGSTDEAVQADLAALPGALDKIDAWIADGTLGGEPPERRRPSDRDQPAAAHELRGPPPGDRVPPRGRDGASRRPRLPRAHAPGVPGRVALPAAPVA